MKKKHIHKHHPSPTYSCLAGFCLELASKEQKRSCNGSPHNIIHMRDQYIPLLPLGITKPLKLLEIIVGFQATKL
jgi:hypothetical protein